MLIVKIAFFLRYLIPHYSVMLLRMLTKAENNIYNELK